jgi:hypothetical protein
MEKKIVGILLGLVCLGAGPLFAEETVQGKSGFQKIMAVEKRGAVNFLSSPAELFYAFQQEKKDHPKAWPLTYLPAFFTKAAVRVGSSVNDILVIPWYVTTGDDTPLTRRFDLPDYVWQKE